MLVKNKNIEEDKWCNLLEKSNYASPFQTPEFYNFFNSVSDYSADVIALEEDNEYKALVIVTKQKEKGIKGIFSKRGIVYGGPVILETSSDNLRPLLEGISLYYKSKLIYLEIRNHFDYSMFSEVFQKFGWEYEERLNVQLEISNLNVDNVLAGMKYNRRREIKLSYKEGVTAREAESEEEIKILYEMLDELYKERVKLPLPDISFFINLYKSTVGKVFVVLHNDKIIGGSFCVYHESMSIYTLYYVGLRNYHKKIYPTHIAIMVTLNFAIENKLKMIDFMGAGKPNVDYGVRKYKLEFGGDLVEHGRFIKIFNPFMFKLGVFGLKVLSKF